MGIPRGAFNSKRSMLITLLFFTSVTAWGLTGEAEKVSVEVYYESLCPDSASFIVNYLDKLFTDRLIDIVDLRLIPYGNARIGSNETINCQHGPYECVLNTIEACAIDAWPNLNQHFPFVSCIESFVWAHEATKWKTCFEKTGLDSKVIMGCYESGYGKKLELQYAAETNSLKPPHQYVPWVVLNGQPLYENYENVEEYICKAYKGTLPQACGNLLKSLSSANAEGKGDGNRYCMKDTLILNLMEGRNQAKQWKP
ncbi:gamma-interferon-responsive lysosomal thiol protein isoform X2 [Cryptomeria japonica]|uniref:gamma-interferon-responsive lysosomal thiol protein isoform X2 n=1 Tax=Cryptomeria japonica TaxID=3369 RepID=UPI0025AB6ACE|nr:gamma-interferon-responsive lysosomal thiol protein isoform X2 [Cryptomeria japonica]